VLGKDYYKCKPGLPISKTLRLAANITAKIPDAKKVSNKVFKKVPDHKFQSMPPLWASLVGRVPDLENILSHPAASGFVFAMVAMTLSMGILVRALRQHGENQFSAPLLEGSD
jgi:hypothetical protein